MKGLITLNRRVKNVYQCPYEERDETNKGAGRPCFLIPEEQLEGLRSLYFSWTKIAEILGVSEKTIRRRRHELGMAVGYYSSYSDISDDELDVFVGHIIDLSPQMICQIFLSSAN